MLVELPLDMDGVSKTPAALHLFNTDEGAEKLPKEKGKLFHHLVAKLLYLCQRTRQDIQTAVAFLCTRVQAPNVDDHKKLAKVMQYLCGTKQLTLTIEPDRDHNPSWWVDSSYAVHLDMRSHSGIIMTLGRCATYTASTKQKINTKSSTEAELVAIDDSMAQVLRTRHFRASQGIRVPTTTIYQDNKSTILLPKNGKTSSGRRTKHLDICFFLHRQDQEGRAEGGILPHTEYAGGLLHKTAAR